MDTTDATTPPAGARECYWCSNPKPPRAFRAVCTDLEACDARRRAALKDTA